MKKNKSKKLIIIAVIVFSLAAGIAFIYYKTKNTSKVKDSKTLPTEVKTNSQNNTEQNVADANSKKLEDNKQMSQKLAKPTLNKSSGYNGPIPVDSTVNFICLGGTGLECRIELSKSDEPDKTLVLEKKTIQSDRSQGYASWDWVSALGKWSIKAIINDNAGNTNTSDVQILEVTK